MIGLKTSERGRLVWSVYPSSSPLCIIGIAALRSIPVQKLFSPAAVRIATHRSGSLLKSANAASMASSISGVKAFIASGRLMVMTAMRSRFSYSMVDGSCMGVSFMKGATGLGCELLGSGPAELGQGDVGSD